MKIFCKFLTVNISKLNFWLVICIAKNFIWTTLKVIFSIFRFFCTLRFQIFKYCPIITNHTSMERYLFSFQMMYESQFWKIDPYDWFCAPGSQMVSSVFNGFHLDITVKLYIYCIYIYIYIYIFFLHLCTLESSYSNYSKAINGAKMQLSDNKPLLKRKVFIITLMEVMTPSLKINWKLEKNN